MERIMTTTNRPDTTPEQEAEAYSAWVRDCFPGQYGDVGKSQSRNSNPEFLGLGGAFNVSLAHHSEEAVRKVLFAARDASSRVEAAAASAPRAQPEKEGFRLLRALGVFSDKGADNGQAVSTQPDVSPGPTPATKRR
jgi:hypothetical protein